MSQKDKILKEISELISAKPIFSSSNVDLPAEELERILSGLRNFKGKNSQKIGGRPESIIYPCEAKTQYRHKMSEYIEENTGIKIPVSSIISSRFYNALADYLGL